MTTTTDVSLPESLFVLVRAGEGKGLQVLKAANPEGEVVAFAFTRDAAMREFAQKAGFGLEKSAVRGMQIATATLLEELANADETILHLNPMQDDERVISYEGNGVLRREYGELKREVRPARTALPDRFAASLKLVAASLPTVEAIWLLESAPLDEHLAADVRMLLVVKQSIAADVDGFELAFMELGDQWCETLPAGIAIDMAPWEVEGVREHTSDACRVYLRDGAFNAEAGQASSGEDKHGDLGHGCCGGGCSSKQV